MEQVGIAAIMILLADETVDRSLGFFVGFVVLGLWVFLSFKLTCTVVDLINQTGLLITYR